MLVEPIFNGTQGFRAFLIHACAREEGALVTQADEVVASVEDLLSLLRILLKYVGDALAQLLAIVDAMGLGLKQAAAGIIDIVNENMFGALRLVSIEQGYDPRDFALIAFGGAGPLHANALGRLMGSWPVISAKSRGS